MPQGTRLALLDEQLRHVARNWTEQRRTCWRCGADYYESGNIGTMHCRQHAVGAQLIGVDEWRRNNRGGAAAAAAQQLPRRRSDGSVPLVWTCCGRPYLELPHTQRDALRGWRRIVVRSDGSGTNGCQRADHCEQPRSYDAGDDVVLAQPLFAVLSERPRPCAPVVRAPDMYSPPYQRLCASGTRVAGPHAVVRRFSPY